MMTQRNLCKLCRSNGVERRFNCTVCIVDEILCTHDTNHSGSHLVNLKDSVEPTRTLGDSFTHLFWVIGSTNNETTITKVINGVGQIVDFVHFINPDHALDAKHSDNIKLPLHLNIDYGMAKLNRTKCHCLCEDALPGSRRSMKNDSAPVTNTDFLVELFRLIERFEVLHAKLMLLTSSEVPRNRLLQELLMVIKMGRINLWRTHHWNSN